MIESIVSKEVGLSSPVVFVCERTGLERAALVTGLYPDEPFVVDLVTWLPRSAGSEAKLHVRCDITGQTPFSWHWPRGSA